MHRVKTFSTGGIIRRKYRPKVRNVEKLQIYIEAKQTKKS